MRQLTDQLGTPVPKGGHVEGQFSDADIVRECLLGIQNYMRILARLELSRRASLVRYLGKVRETLPKLGLLVEETLEAFPYAICEKCKGVPKWNCTACNNRGWWSRKDYELAEVEREYGRRNEDYSKRSPMRSARKVLSILKMLNRIEDGDGEED